MTATATKAKGLHAKLAEVMVEAGRIPKNGQYQGQGAFKYVMVGDAADEIRKALGSRAVSMLPSAVEVMGETEHATKSGGTMTTLTIRTTWTLVDGETGETATIQSIGTGADSGDKASPKAQTNAMKYALLMGFLLSTGDDPEQSDSSDRMSVGRPEDEKAEMLGNFAKSGKVEKGTADGYKLEWQETPDGHTIGFRVKLDGDDRAVPQVRVMGAIGEALYVATSGTGKSLLGLRVSFKGKLYNVRQAPPRQSYYRLIIGESPTTDFFETPDGRFPPLTESEPELAALAAEATPEPLFPDTPVSMEEAAAIFASEMEEAEALP